MESDLPLVRHWRADTIVLISNGSRVQEWKQRSLRIISHQSSIEIDAASIGKINYEIEAFP